MKPSKESLVDLFIDRKKGSFRPLGRFAFFSAFFIQSAVIDPEKALLGISACVSYAVVLGIGSERINQVAIGISRSAVRLATPGKYGKNS